MCATPELPGVFAQALLASGPRVSYNGRWQTTGRADAQKPQRLAAATRRRGDQSPKRARAGRGVVGGM